MGNAAFGAGVLPIYFSNFQCTGVEDNLMECPNRGPETFCRHNEDAGVICRGMFVFIPLQLLLQKDFQ